MPKRRDSRSVVLVAKGAAAAAAFTPLVAVVNAQPAAADFSHCPGVFPPPGWTNLTGDADGAFVPGTSTSYRNSTYYRYTWNSCYQGQQNLWTQSGLQLYDVNNALCGGSWGSGSSSGYSWQQSDCNSTVWSVRSYHKIANQGAYYTEQYADYR